MRRFRTAAIATRTVVAVLALLLVAMAVIGSASDGTVVASSDPASQDAPPVTVSDFYPESSNLSDCVGLVEKPGCGSESRGGVRQVVIFGLLLIGLGIIVWRITAGLRANQATASDSGPDGGPRPGHPGDPTPTPSRRDP